jgi:hypothetical protein
MAKANSRVRDLGRRCKGIRTLLSTKEGVYAVTANPLTRTTFVSLRKKGKIGKVPGLKYRTV